MMRSDRGANDRLAEEMPDAHGRCWFCGRPFERRGQLRRTDEHLTPRCLGGGSVPDIENLVNAHGICNEFAGDLTREEKAILREILTASGPPLTRIEREHAMFEILARMGNREGPNLRTLFERARPE